MNNFIFILSIVIISRYIIDIIFRFIQSSRNEEITPIELTVDEKIILYLSISYFLYYIFY